MDEGNTTNRLIYSREFLIKFDKYTLDSDIANLVNQLNNNWPRHTPKKVIISTRSGESTPPDPKSPNRFSKSTTKKKNLVSLKFEKNGKVPPLKSLRVAPPPGFSKSDFLENHNDTVSKSNSFPSVFQYHTHAATLGDDVVSPRKMASYPLISYPDLFSTLPYDPAIENYGESKFTSLFSQQPGSAELCGEINLKVPYLSLDFIEDPPQQVQQIKNQNQNQRENKIAPQLAPPLPVTPQMIQVTPKTPNSKPLLSPKSHEANEKSPFKNSKTPQKSPRNRPVSPLDDQRLIQRQKQIDYGYRTVGYLRYRLLVPKESRKPEHPRTPKKAQGCSKRSWDGQLKKWRRDLHLWDPDNLEAFRALLNSEVVETLVASNPELEDVVRAVREKLENPNSKNSDDDYFDYDEDSNPSSSNSNPIQRKNNSVKTSGEENQVISEPNNNKPRVARTLIFT